MAGITSSLQIGQSALAAYQSAIAVVGQNIANVGNPDYTRQSARLAAVAGNRGLTSPLGDIGAGVQMNALQRHMDAALEARLRSANSEQSAAEVAQRYLTQIESLYNELTDTDLSTQLGDMFASFGALETSPENSGLRDVALASASTVVNTLHLQRSGLVSQIEELNSAAEYAVSEVNTLAAEIAELNSLIVVQESDGRSISSTMRDRRNAVLNDLARLTDITTHEQNNGTLNVYVGSEPLVEFDRSWGLELEREHRDGVEVATVRFAHNHSTALISSGQLGAIINSRDGAALDQINRLDQLATGIIYEANRVHSTGAGLVGLEQATGAYDVLDADAALNSTAAGPQPPAQQWRVHRPRAQPDDRPDRHSADRSGPRRPWNGHDAHQLGRRARRRDRLERGRVFRSPAGRAGRRGARVLVFGGFLRRAGGPRCECPV